MTVQAQFGDAGPVRIAGGLRFGGALLALCVTLSMPVAVCAQGLVQATPTSTPTSGNAGAGNTAQALDAALARLARNPRDVDSLVAAGRAALALGDTDAAVGFFSRADKLAPATPRVLAGLAVAKVRSRDPLAALPLFDMADTGGALSADDIADRGLAYDLVGDNRKAQTYYRRALAGGAVGDAGGEATRRLVLSNAIAGDRLGYEAALRPLLASGDRAAVRTQAFALAILGHEDEAVAVVQANLSPELATAIAPYLRYMRKLTPAQQAAAANLGQFPHAADIGVDDPRIAQYAAEHQLGRGRGELALAPVAEAAGTRGKARAPDHARKRPAPLPNYVAANPAPPELPPGSGPSREEASGTGGTAGTFAAGASGSLAMASPSAPPPRPYGPLENDTRPAGGNDAPLASGYAPAAPSAAPVSVPVVQPVPGPAPAPAPAPAFTPSPAPGVASVAATPPATPAPPRKRVNFADAFAAMGEDASVFEPAPGAVDIRKITPPRTPVKVPPKAPPPPAHPSRIWVELGVGRDTDRLGFDWHRMTRDDPDLFARRKPFVTGWARTNRLLTGPFDTQASADAFVQHLRKAGHDGVFVWTSPAGQVVDPLDAR